LSIVFLSLKYLFLEIHKPLSDTIHPIRACYLKKILIAHGFSRGRGGGEKEEY